MFGSRNKDIENEAHQLLIKHNAFYRKLPINLQLEFRNRVNVFMREKTWRNETNRRPSFEQRIAISASAIQVTFAFRNYTLDEFHTITVYPDTYVNPMTGNRHRGEVSPMLGTIAISWKDFLFGNSIDDDHFNVGLHEMGHAFYFNTHIMRDEVETSYDLMSKFLFLSEAEIVKIRQNHSTLFRKYAGENAAEFFAIAVEYFFEESDNFKEKLPVLYKHMCLVLRMDPSQKIYKNIDFSKYFTQRNFDNYYHLNEPIVLDKKKAGFHIYYPLASFISVFYVIVFIAILFYNIMGDQIAGISISALMLVLAIPIYNILYNQNIEATENYLLIHKNSLFDKKNNAIHFDNILSIDLGYEDSTLDIKYFHNKHLELITLSKNVNADNALPMYLAKRNVMIKNDGKRISRIKSRGLR